MAPSTPQRSTYFLTSLTDHVLRQPKVISSFLVQLLAPIYTFASWSSRPEPSPDAEEVTFSYHRTHNLAAIVGGLCFVIVMEALPLHFLFSPYNPAVAWMLGGLDVYFGLWLLGNLNAMRLRPILLEDKKLHLGMGLFSQTTVALADIEAIETVQPSDEAPTEGRGYVNMAVFLFAFRPSLVLTLKEPVRVRRFDRLDKKARRLGLVVDDARSFEKELRQRIEAVQGAAEGG